MLRIAQPGCKDRNTYILNLWPVLLIGDVVLMSGWWLTQSKVGSGLGAKLSEIRGQGENVPPSLTTSDHTYNIHMRVDNRRIISQV